MAGEMTRIEREAFVAGVHVGILAIDEPGRGPLALPVWYQFEDGAIVVGMSGASLKAGLLRAAGRATLTVQTETPPYLYASVEGPVTIEAKSRDDLAMATRYLGPELGKWYADANPSTADTVLVTISPEHWRTKDFSKLMNPGS